VLVDGRCTDASIPSVVPDEFQGGITAVREFVRQGHTKIAFVNSVDEQISASSGRLAGYRAGLDEAGLEFRHDYVRRARTDAAGGFEVARSLLRLADPPRAIFAFNDRTAMGVYQAASEYGLQIPTELSVIGFDNQHSVADGLSPGLTTLALPHYEMGSWGVHTLVRQIEQLESPRAEQTTLPCPLVRRGSVAPPAPAHPQGWAGNGAPAHNNSGGPTSSAKWRSDSRNR
jgi:LacI family transcriptional regulator